jgi:small subunit ribosomal protein S16
VLKIRLRRTGAKKQPRYRVVVAESSAPRDGAFVEILGWYNPQADPAQVVINTEKAAEWIKRGAQPSDRVAYLLKQAEAAASQPEPTPEPTAAGRGRAKAVSTAEADTAEMAAPVETAADAPAAEEPPTVASRSRSRRSAATGADEGTAGGEGTVEMSGAAAEVSPSEAPEEEGSAGSAE